MNVFNTLSIIIMASKTGNWSAKAKALAWALANINKKYGTNAAVKMKDFDMKVPVMSTGIPSYDIILGGGIPEGRIVEIFGEEASWKTSFTLQLLGQVQQEGETVAFIDAEHALNPEFAQKLGVDTDEMILAQPNSWEDALDIAQELAASGAVKLIVIDSVSALTPRAEVAGEIGDSTIGLQARMLGQALRKLTPIASQTGTTIIFINQTRMKIGVLYGDPTTTSGGKALKFFASQRMKISKVGKITANKLQIGHNMKVKVIKNKIAVPFKEAEVPFIYSKGFDKIEILIDTLMENNIITRGGAFYSFVDHTGKQEKLRGRDAVKAYFEEPGIYDHFYALADKLFKESKLKTDIKGDDTIKQITEEIEGVEVDDVDEE